MTRKGTVVAAMSGGVDSAVAAALLKREGYDVIGITLQIWQEQADQSRHGGCCSLGAVEDARRAANRIGIPHYVLNFKDHFGRQVIDKFVSEYARGRTPNPCVECNRSVKFDELLKQAANLGADYLATGHYARIRFNETTGRHELWQAVDKKKDQTYFLYTMTQAQLSKTLMPVGELSDKEATRSIARELGLSIADKPDSQEICFVPRGGYTAFLRERAPQTLQQGPIVDTSGAVRGTHEGIANYTVGQRRRLPASGDGALYVVALEPATNTVIVGSDKDLYAAVFTAENCNWTAAQAPTQPIAISARIRYNAPACSAELRPGDRDTVTVELSSPQRAITPGQASVFYDGECVVGGGTIAGIGSQE
jgi:tRNA-specific 2-thiouridylase